MLAAPVDIRLTAMELTEISFQQEATAGAAAAAMLLSVLSASVTSGFTLTARQASHAHHNKGDFATLLLCVADKFIGPSFNRCCSLPCSPFSCCRRLAGLCCGTLNDCMRTVHLNKIGW